ncbi:PREDICTED: replication protein A 32 kDa subunit-A-like [Acropora digitifera]|uniref:replication protein A 32 kDa subunit-A-like n=1 Tax=Acropora digitifera TaxID=70779 RepID=UPI00077AAC39|nr:PREDICTED: replication protein A 32 kDa subunit-A-like [Acropora digitifera]
MSFARTITNAKSEMWNDTNQFGGGYQSMDSFGGGGGYMQDGGSFASPMGESQEKKRSASRVQSVIPCTIKQLHSATYNQTEDTFKLGDLELNQVTIVGVIRDAQESATNIMYNISDMTSEDIIVRKWIDNEVGYTLSWANSYMVLLLLHAVTKTCSFFFFFFFRENTYVRVFGHLKSFKENSRSLIAFGLSPVTDFNEITYHMLDVVHSHLALSKLPEMSDMSLSMRQGSTPGMHGFQGQTPGRMNQGGFGGNTAGTHAGLTGIQQQIQSLITNCQQEEGMAFAVIKQKVRGISDAQIRSTLEFLSNEGHIYSTIDDDHYKSTDSY